jgi:predicted transcriptional regulator
MLESTDSTSDSKRLLERLGASQYHCKLSDSQSNILKAIGQYPGIRYKELARKTGFANGVLTYHLNILEQFGYVNKFRHNNIARYYLLSIPSSDLKIISHLRVYSEKDIILFLLGHDFCTFNEIVEHLRKAPSTVSWHLKRLCEDGILVVHHGEYNLYRINDKKLVDQILHKYKESFTDKIVNNLVDIADEL